MVGVEIGGRTDQPVSLKKAAKLLEEFELIGFLKAPFEDDDDYRSRRKCIGSESFTQKGSKRGPRGYWCLKWPAQTVEHNTKALSIFLHNLVASQRSR